MTVSLTPAEAELKIQQIESARAHAVQKLGQIEQSQEQMLAGSWHGDSATTYGNTSQQQHEEFRSLIAALDDIIQKGSEHMRSVASADQS
jgi:WXG100 family type VII secretion target